MQALQLIEPRNFKLIETEMPTLEPHEVMFKVQGCGVCASNLSPWQGQDWFNYPMAPGALGHEAWGIVEHVGSEVFKVKVGQRISALSNNAYAEYDKASQDDVLVLPQFLNDRDFPGEPLGCALNIFERADIKKGQQVAIVGIGFLGALLVQLCKAKGAKVIAISRRESTLRLALELGADYAVPLHNQGIIIGQVKESTQRKFCDRVIECTGKEWPLNLSAELTKERGKLIIAGYHQDGMRQINLQLWNWRGLDVINAHERDSRIYLSGIERAIDAVQNKIITPEKLFTHYFKPHELNQALEMQEQKPDNFIKAIIKFHE